jgi:hypothetical protein
MADNNRTTGLIMLAACALALTSGEAYASMGTEYPKCSVTYRGQPTMHFDKCTSTYSMNFGFSSSELTTPNGGHFHLENGLTRNNNSKNKRPWVTRLLHLWMADPDNTITPDEQKLLQDWWGSTWLDGRLAKHRYCQETSLVSLCEEGESKLHGSLVPCSVSDQGGPPRHFSECHVVQSQTNGPNGPGNVVTTPDGRRFEREIHGDPHQGEKTWWTLNGVPATDRSCDETSVVSLCFISEPPQP